MINRYYHISVRKNHGDGTTSYSYMAATGCLRSWFQNPEQARREIIEKCEKQLESKPGRLPLEIISFSRI